MLTEKAVAQAKSREKSYRLYDKDGMYLEVSPAGGKLWKLKYRFQGKEKRLSLGKYPFVTLKEAREQTFEARRLLSEGIDPSAAKKHISGPSGGLFKDVAREWWEKFILPLGGHYPRDVWSRLEREVLPVLGERPIAQIEAPDILAILKRIEARGTVEKAHKVRGNISKIFVYSIALGLTHRDPARDLSAALAPNISKPMAAITDPKGVGRLMRSICGYEGSVVVRIALQFLALTFVRQHELRHAEWREVDFVDAVWRIPQEKMKKRKPHIVPLSRQALALLKDLHNHTGHGRYVFPSVRTLERPISDMTINAALRYLGYTGEQMTGHGFRAMANTLLSERGWGVDIIERQLAHVERSKVRAAYHRAEYLEDRKKMMQDWADYLDALRES